MAGATITGGLVSSLGQILGAELGQANFSQGNQILPNYSPATNLELAASNFDAMNQIGFGDPSTIPGPFEQLIGRIQALPLDEKTKRRGLLALQQVRDGEQPNGALSGAMDAVLSRVGLSAADIPDVIERQAVFKDQIGRLNEIAGVNTDTVLNRARAAQSASGLIGSAAGLASGGQRNTIQDAIRNRLSRQIDDSEEAALLRGSLGGFNPSQALEGAARMRQDLDLSTIEQSLLMASGITGALNGSLSGAQNAAGTSNQANLGALGIAAQQSQAANALQNQTNLFNADMRANGIAGAGNTLGGALAAAAAQDKALIMDGISMYMGGGMGGMAPAAGG